MIASRGCYGNKFEFQCPEYINFDDTFAKVACQFGYVHQRGGDGFFRSLSAERDWVCGREGLGAGLLAAQSAGVVANTLVFMHLGDAWGRAPVLHLTNLLSVAGRAALLFVSDFYWAALAATVVGTAFFPVGWRVGYALSKSSDQTNWDSSKISPPVQLPSTRTRGAGCTCSSTGGSPGPSG